ncbi:MAG: hypothetical protein WA821_11495 [Anaerolineales bacterium]
METPVQAEPKKSNTGLIIGIGGIVAALLCCCLVFIIVVIAAVTIMGPLVGKVYSTINNSLLTPVNDFPVNPGLTQIPSGVIPQGGLGDQIQRASAWGYVMVTAARDGCTMNNPSASDIQIKVKQKPDSQGAWVEEWTVACDGGSRKTYTVTFTPKGNGETDIKVK